MKHVPYLIAALALALSACSTNQGTSDESDVLVTVGNSKLLHSDLVLAMPGGLSAEDSVIFARAFIRNWIDTRIVSEIAAKEIDLTEIDKMVEQYRNELILWEYTRRMYESHKQIDLPEDSIHAYYVSHPEEFVLKRPMIQGVYIKVADKSESLPVLRAAYRSTDSKDLDRIEKSVLTDAVQYDYFIDSWVDWEQIESHVPYEFGDSDDAFLRRQRNLDFSLDGFTYLLNVTDVRYSGQTMPYEAARDYIIDRLTFHDKRAYDLTLREKLYRNGLASGQIRLGCDMGE